jgi:hypothetical protein
VTYPGQRIPVASIDDPGQLILVIQACLDRLRGLYSIDLIKYHGTAQYEQRCRRCGFWIMAGMEIYAIQAPYQPADRSIYVHAYCPQVIP